MLRIAGDEGGPDGAVNPSIRRLAGAHSRAISTMSVVSAADVFGLTRAIRFMRDVKLGIRVMKSDSARLSSQRVDGA